MPDRRDLFFDPTIFTIWKMSAAVNESSDCIDSNVAILPMNILRMLV